VIIDRAGSTIKAAVFNEGVHLFNNTLQNGTVCSYSGGKIKKSIQLRTDEPYQLAFDQRASIMVLNDDHFSCDLAIPLSTIEELAVAKAGSKVSIVGVISYVEAAKRFVHKSGETRFKRDILVVDNTMRKIVCTLWGFDARQALDVYLGKPVLIRLGTLNDYLGVRSITAFPGSSILFDPSLDATNDLRQWYAANPDTEAFSFIVPTPST
jgi:hypothetical protein